MSEDELKQSAIVMATFAWQAAMADEKIRVPRGDLISPARGASAPRTSFPPR